MKEHLETLTEIRSLMERSSRFLSLSGLSGIWAGVSALVGAAVIFIFLDINPGSYGDGYYYNKAIRTVKWGMDYKSVFVLVAFMVLVSALSGGIYFTTRKARRKGHKVWDHTSKRLVLHLAVPLIAGGLFCCALFYHNLVGLIAPSTLVFYGLALINGSKFTVRDVAFLGYSELILGIFGCFVLGYGLEIWALGFGFLHILYGAIMYYKYEK